MKTNLRAVILGAGIVTLLLCFGRNEESVNAENVPTVQAKPPANTNSAPDPRPADPKIKSFAAVPSLPLAATAAGNTDASATNASPAENRTNVIENVATPEALNPSPALTEVIRLIQAGVSEDVLAAYITNSADIFNIGSNEILYLHDLGTPSTIITALIQHDSTPETVARKQAAVAVKPLPPGIALNKPATNLYSKAAMQPVKNPPEPIPVDSPSPTTATAAGPNLVSETTQTVVDTTPVIEQPEDVSYFYTSLAPYGTWIDLPGNGRCWRPTVAVWNSTWRPYGDCGRWLWTDSGWYWYSDYSWGWAPFHYGRWTCSAGIGWVWAPDTCWGPSWVSWRHTSSYCAWAPLPPSARFVHGHGFYYNNVRVGVDCEFGLALGDYWGVPTSRFCDRRLSTYAVAGPHAREILKTSTTANNYVSVNGAGLINKGVGFDRITAATRGNVRQVTIKGTTDVRSTNLRREVLDRDGKTLTVVRPSGAGGTIPPSSTPVAATGHRQPEAGHATVPQQGQSISAAGAPVGAAAVNRLSDANRSTPRSELINGRIAGTSPGIPANTDSERFRQPQPVPTARGTARVPGRSTGRIEHEQPMTAGNPSAANSRKPNTAQPAPIIIQRSKLPGTAQPTSTATLATPSTPPSSIVRTAPNPRYVEPAAPRPSIARVPEPIQPRFVPQAPPPTAPPPPSVSRVESHHTPAPSAPSPARSSAGSSPSTRSSTGGSGRGDSR